MSRRGSAALALVALVAAGCGGTRASGKPTVIVLGFDGMDYELTKQMMAEGRLPNLSKLAALGTFQSLGTSMPPQSPVAWSNFITGLDSGGYGIYDFVHRDPDTMIPYLSTSRALPSDKKLKLGKWFDAAFRSLYAMRGLRGTALDPFGRADVRRVERALIGEYRTLVDKAMADLSPETYDRAVKVAELPDIIRGYEEIKLRNVAKFREQARTLGL